MERYARILLVCLLLGFAGPAPGAEPVRLLVQFDASLGVQELKAAQRWGRQWIARGTAAGLPVVLRMVRIDSVVLISFQSQAVCDRINGCPLLVFHDIAKAPVLVSSSFENILQRQLPAGIELTLRSRGGPDRLCLVTNSVRARCRPVGARR